MTRIAKLYSQLVIDRRRLTFSEFVRLIEAFDFRLYRTSGSHRIYVRIGIPDKVNVQPKGKDAKDYQVQQFLTIVMKHGLNLDTEE